MEFDWRFIEKSYINEDYSGNVAPITKEQTKKILSQLENCVCKIYEISGNKGTGFFVKFHFLTNLNYYLF